ncbi:hypothetical protein V8C37DRAFT_325151 [Trichoderma ceciliae]
MLRSRNTHIPPKKGQSFDRRHLIRRRFRLCAATHVLFCPKCPSASCPFLDRRKTQWQTGRARLEVHLSRGSHCCKRLSISFWSFAPSCAQALLVQFFQPKCKQASSNSLESHNVLYLTVRAILALRIQIRSHVMSPVRNDSKSLQGRSSLNFVLFSTLNETTNAILSQSTRTFNDRLALLSRFALHFPSSVTLLNPRLLLAPYATRHPSSNYHSMHPSLLLSSPK